MSTETLIYEKEDYEEGSVVTLTMNKPETLNALNIEFSREIDDALTKVEQDDDVKVVVLKGAGKAFSAGYDLGRVYFVYGGGTGKPEDKTRRPSQRSRLAYDRWRSESLRKIFLLDKITIAQVHGYCIGGGLYMSLCCDLTIAAEDAKIGHSEQRLGFSGTMYVFPIEVMLIGQKRARELLLTGKLIDGKEAERIGLVNQVVASDQLEAETRKLAKSMTLLPRDGIAIGKACARMTYDSMGLSSAFGQGYLGHTMFTNTRFEPGEYNFIKRRRDVGLREAVKERDARYKGLIE
ncbi:MAG: enoyl-CoA hydratase/isomerase family protein, partial [Desulfobacterales bacterium]|jgi:enoyl-CoA hydratase|nr:enoyl-CoA hydratase/isomerase family protein [Desulfobacterales bacterium]NOQ18339.1 enoyl-CoA hydratase/isomerase family protein [Desulfobacterales bacterium]